MATEYKLSYTASEIDEKLGKIDENTTNISKLSEEIADIKENGTGGGVVVSSVEPETDDIPKVFFSEAIPQTKTDATTAFRYISKTKDISGYAEFKAQGNSSMSYPKKNMTVKMYSDEALTEKLKVDFKEWGEQARHVYKANWIDLTHARNIVSARLWADVVKSREKYLELPELLRTSPNQGAVDGFPVKVYSQGIYQGRYTLNIPKDAWMANMDDALDNHCILCGENYVSGCFRATASINGNDWSDEVHETVPISIKTRWNEVISFVMNSTDEEFVANLENYFFVDSLIDYYIFGLVSCGLDAFGVNQLYFTYDGIKWIASMYDMDSTWGLWWTGASFVESNYARTDFQDFKDGQGNLLYIRLEQLFTERIKERYAELKNGALSVSNIINHFERFTDIVSLDLVKEDYAITTANGAFTGIPSQTTNNIQQIRKFVVDRYAYCDTYIVGLGASEPTPDEPDIPVEPEEPSGIIWSETAEYCIDVESGTIVEGADYVSEPISLEDGYVYEINQPTGGTFLKCAVYDSNGTYKYYRMLNEDPNGVLYIDGFNGTNIRLSINPESPDELDLSTVVPVKTDRIWSVVKYKTDLSNGNIYFNGTDDYFTLQKIPVEGGATYKFGTTGTHKYLKWFEYSGQGDYLGYKGGVNEGAKELEETVAKLTTHVILCAYTGETPVDDYVTFIKTADAPQEPDVPEEPIVPPTGLVYELAEPMTFNGTSDYIDTGVKLYDEDKDFTILMEIEEDEAVVSGAILHCMYEDAAYQGIAIDHGDNKSDLLLTLVGNGDGETISFSDNGKTRIAIVKSSNHYTIRYVHNMLSEPIVLVDKDKGFMKHDNPLVIGAYRTNSGTYGRFWNGTIHNFKVYSSALSDEETTAFLMGE